MPDVIDVYADQFQVNIGAWGATLNFQLSSSQPPAPGSLPSAERVATVRTSLEHLKVMVFMMKRQFQMYEQGNSVQVNIPQVVLNALGIALEDWEAFWR